MKVLLSTMSEKQWAPFYLDLDPSESAIQPVWIGHIVDKKFKADLNPGGGGGVHPKMAYTKKLQALSTREGWVFTC